MDPITLGLILGAGAGGVKHILAGQQEQRQNNIRAEQTRYSPWTGITPDKAPVHDNAMGSLLQGAGSGAMIGSGMGGADPATETAVPMVTAADSPAAAASAVQSTDIGTEAGGPVKGYIGTSQGVQASRLNNPLNSAAMANSPWAKMALMGARQQPANLYSGVNEQSSPFAFSGSP